VQELRRRINLVAVLAVRDDGHLVQISMGRVIAFTHARARLYRVIRQAECAITLRQPRFSIDPPPRLGRS
jgi:hypothetical protein